jgi:hypothetical protein
VALGVLELTADLCRLDVICPDGVMRHNVADLDLYPSTAGTSRLA